VKLCNHFRSNIALPLSKYRNADCIAVFSKRLLHPVRISFLTAICIIALEFYCQEKTKFELIAGIYPDLRAGKERYKIRIFKQTKVARERIPFL
jgi:hypothetical protein